MPRRSQEAIMSTRRMFTTLLAGMAGFNFPSAVTVHRINLDGTLGDLIS
jgi:hypothetical protein